jgi:hypothetical protein
MGGRWVPDRDPRRGKVTVADTVGRGGDDRGGGDG